MFRKAFIIILVLLLIVGVVGIGLWYFVTQYPSSPISQTVHDYLPFGKAPGGNDTSFGNNTNNTDTGNNTNQNNNSNTPVVSGAVLKQIVTAPIGGMAPLVGSSTEPAQENEFVVKGRIGSSAFSASNLDAYLRNNHIKTLFIRICSARMR